MSIADRPKNGDVVRLKSGGPKMTVFDDALDNDMILSDVIICVWFDDTTRIEGRFHVTGLDINPAD